ncbi:choice-of-anchor D domain-containing protein [Halobaculum sp. MBLA0147]|uniref:choice-of-anchor D domain-containing protein n=1 Tax=Halobaculum sp. MBLA0147 TaxID=3079934 RepID=UPI0035257FF4
MTSTRRLAVVVVAWLTVTATVVPFVAVPVGTVTAANDGCTALTTAGNDDGITVSESGCYVLGQDVTDDTEAPTVTVTADDVVIDGGGNVLSAAAVSTPTATPTATPTQSPVDGERVGVYVDGARDVTVRNISTSGYDTAVYVQNGLNVSLASVATTASAQAGAVGVDGAETVSLVNATVGDVSVGSGSVNVSLRGVTAETVAASGDGIVNLSIRASDVGELRTSGSVAGVSLRNSSASAVDFATGLDGALVVDSRVTDGGVEATGVTDLIVLRTAVERSYGPAVDLESTTRATVRAVQIEDVRTAESVAGVGIRVRGDATGTRVTDTTIRGVPGTGIVLSADGTLVRNVTVTETSETTVGRNPQPPTADGDAVLVNGSGDSQFVETRLTDVTVTGTAGSALDVTGVERLLFTDGQIRDTNESAVRVRRSANVTVNDTTVSWPEAPAPSPGFVYVDDSDGNLKSYDRGGDVTDYGVGDAGVIGPRAFLDDDERREVPYVDTSGNVELVDATGGVVELLGSGEGPAEPETSKSKLAVGDWDHDGATDVFFAGDDGALYRTDWNERGTAEVISTTTSVESVLGVADVTGDGVPEIVYLSPSDSNELRAVNATGGDTELADVGSLGVDNQYGIGGLARVDGEWVAPRVSGGNSPELQVFDGNGTVEQLSGVGLSLPKTAPAGVNLSGDATPEFVYPTSAGGVSVLDRNGDTVAVELGVNPNPSVGLASRASTLADGRRVTGDGVAVWNSTGDQTTHVVDVTVDGVGTVSPAVRNVSLQAERRLPRPPTDTVVAADGGLRVRPTDADSVFAPAFGYAPTALVGVAETTTAVGAYDTAAGSWRVGADALRTERSTRFDTVRTTDAVGVPAVVAPLAGATGTRDTRRPRVTAFDATANQTLSVELTTDEVLPDPVQNGASSLRVVVAERNVSENDSSPFATLRRGDFEESVTQTDDGVRATYTTTVDLGGLNETTDTLDVVTLILRDDIGNWAPVRPSETVTVNQIDGGEDGDEGDGDGDDGDGPTTLVVDADGTSTYDSVSLALLEAESGDRVEVRPGVYTESIGVDENVTLAFDDGAVLDGTGVDRRSGILIGPAAAPTVAGATVRNFDTGVAAAGTAGDWTLRNLTVRGGEFGVYAAETTGNWTVRNATVLEPAVDGLLAARSTGEWTTDDLTVRNASDDGVDAENTSGDWTATDLTVVGVGDDGVEVDRTTGDWTVRNLTVDGAETGGVDATGSTGAWTLQDAVVSDVDDASAVVAFQTTGNWTVSGLDAARLGGNGLYVEDTSGAWTASDLSIRETALPGVFAENASGDWRLRNVTVRDADDDGLEVDDSGGDWSARDVTVVGAAFDGVSVEGTTGDWSMANVSVRSAGIHGVDADGSTGDWRLQNVTATELPDGSGVTAVDARGDWTLSGLDATQLGGNGLYAENATGDWTARDLSVSATTLPSVFVANTSGDWLIETARLDTPGAAGVYATGSAGDWRIADATVRATTPLLANESGGNWTVRRSRLVAVVDGPVRGGGVDDGSADSVSSPRGVAVYAPNTTGEWRVTRTDLPQTGGAVPRIVAVGGERLASATRNWWGRPSGARPTDCVGLVACGAPTAEPTDAAGFGSVDVPERTTPGETLTTTVEIQNGELRSRTLRVDANLTSGGVASETVTVPAGESTTVALTLSTEGLEARERPYSIRFGLSTETETGRRTLGVRRERVAVPPGRLAVRGLQRRVTARANATLSTKVVNPGSAAASGTVELLVDTDGDGSLRDESVVAAEQAVLDPQANQTVTFPLPESIDDAERPLVRIETPTDRRTRRLRISQPGRLVVASATVPPTSPADGDVVVPVRVRNPGDSAATGSVALRVAPSGEPVDGRDPVATADVTVPPRQNRTVSLRFATGDRAAGDYTLAVTNGQSSLTRETTVASGTPALALPSAVAVGTVDRGTTTTETVTVENDGEAPLNVTGVAVVGADGVNGGATSGASGTPAASRGRGPDTGTVVSATLADAEAGETVTVPAGESTTVSVTVAAGGAEAGPVQARLRVESTDPDDPTATVNVTGRVTGPAAVANRQRVRFFSRAVGSTTTQTVLLENPGTESLDVSDVRITDGGAAFSVRSSPDSIPTDDAGEVTVAFTPAASGDVSGTLVVETDDPTAETIEVSLAGRGRQAEVTLSRSTVAFGAVGSESAPTETVVVANDGGAPATVENVTLTGEANVSLVSTNLTGELVPGERRPVTVRFSPEAEGARSATLRIETDGPQGAFTVPVSGTGQVADARAVSSTVTTGTVGVGSSTLLSVPIANDGDETLVIRNATAAGGDDGAFAVVTADGVRVPPDERRTVSVAFAPTTTGERNTTLLIGTNDPDGATRVDLGGIGAAADVVSDPASVAFGPTPTDTRVTRNVTVRNDGGVAASIADVRTTAASADAFSVVSAPTGETLAAGESATVEVAFRPTARGERTGVVEIANGTETLTTVSLGGVGAVPNATLNTTTVQFADTRVLGESRGTVLVSNDGNAPLNLTDTTIDGDASAFRVVAAPDRVPAGATDRIVVAFTPLTAGSEGGAASRAATLSLSSDDPTGTPTVSLGGTAETVVADVTPGNLTYGSVAVGESTRANVTISNDRDASAPLTLTGASVVGPNAGAYSSTGANATTLTTGGDIVLAPGESTTLNVTLAPSSGGRKFGRLRVFTDDPKTQQLDVFLSNTETIIDVDTTTGTGESAGEPGAEITVRNASADTTVPANVSSPAALRADVGIENLNVSVDTGGNFSVNFSQADDPPARNAPNFSGPNGTNVDPVKYVRVNKTLTDDQIDNATFRLRVSKVQVAESGTDPEEISLYRFVDDEWVELNGTLVEETTTHYVYSVVTPGFSDFAAGAKKPDFEVSRADVPPGDVQVTAIRVGDQVDILVRITNEKGAADGTFTTKLLLDGEVVQTRDVTVAAGGTRQIRFVRTFDESGLFSVEVNGVQAGGVRVGSGGGGGGGVGGGGGGDAELTFPSTDLPTVPVTPGEAVSLSVDVENPGSTPATFDAPLTIEGVVVDDRLVSIPAGERVTVEYTRSFARPGNYSVSIGEANVGTVSVVDPATLDSTPTPTPGRNETTTPSGETPSGTATTPRPDGEGTPAEGDATATPGGPRPTVVEAFVETEEATVGETVDVTAIVENTGDGDGELTVPLVINGVTVATRSVEVPAGESVRVEFERRFQTTGTFELQVANTVVGELVVTEATPVESGTATTADRTPTGTTTGTETAAPGFGPLVALGGLLAAALLARRRGAN